ncbi:MAG: FAD-dependent monooxygenase [Dehalococcoidia bacterium]
MSATAFRIAHASAPAHLVVAASGRGSDAPKWLEAFGYGCPEETLIDAHVGDASRVYAPPDRADIDWKMIFLQSAPPHGTRGAVLLPIEAGRWIVMLLGINGDYPPTNEEGVRTWARGLPSSILSQAIEAATPLTAIRGYRRMENRRRHFDRMNRWPERFIVIGDAAGAFNPIYGQGMSMAANEALVLEHGLRDQAKRRPNGDLRGFARRLQLQIAKEQETPWLMATGVDLRYPGTEGPRPTLLTRLMYRYFDRMSRVATSNERVNAALGDVTNLLAPPAALFRPGVLLPVLRGGVHGPSQSPITWEPALRPSHKMEALVDGNIGLTLDISE